MSWSPSLPAATAPFGGASPVLGNSPDGGCETPFARSLDAVRDQLANLFPDGRFSDANAVRNRYAKTTLPRSTTPLGVVWPVNRDEVSSLMRILSSHQIPWHTISRGRNWGYGDSCASGDGHLIIDMGEMNRIVEINEDLAYAVIEPGVTQGQLADALNSSGSRLMLDVTGAGPDASIVGNVLQRGFGHTPYGDRTAHACNYEAVWPDGNMTRTGFGDIEKTTVGHVYPYGQGPNFQGVLAQSNAAVVTRMTIWLMPRPQRIDGFAFKTDDLSVFARMADRIGKLRQENVIGSVVHLANDLRVLSSQTQVAGDGNALDRRKPFTDRQRAYRAKKAGVAKWNGLGGLYGTNRIVAAKRKDIKKALSGICPVRFFRQRHVNALNFAVDRMPSYVIPERIRNLTAAVTDVYDLLNGKPSAKHLEGAFYRNRPDSGNVIDVGLMWIAPVIPFRSGDVLRLTTELEPIASQFGFDLPVTISPVIPRAAVAVMNLSFDKSDADEASRAEHCYGAMRQRLDEMGYPLYRTSSIKIAA
ncbi:4-cresol dehydrogenase [hydroxylating] flavoprotein subunit [Rubripirellula tenax]|uniref:4-cresol dehydrogenase [hydroxylating] flavoprotein subunit n=1 Tax=Rubripirellula tenax TaxID=2528015 RepID=A0A5C6EZN7_9BACT|nr:FAD-dependent oxidoreductase [Rubripirellula tenax]TWU54502.1 4-cresol dehydrogenase [hydroxylating] flavoprotein subunit [Rubripirellula tenax]